MLGIIHETLGSALELSEKRSEFHNIRPFTAKAMAPQARGGVVAD